MPANTRMGADAAVESWERAKRAASPKVRALLLERLAWSHAVRGKALQAEDALGRARTALHQSGGDREEPDWVFWIDDTEIDIMTGRCWSELRRPLRAIPVLESALARFDATCARDKSLYETWLAHAYLDAGEIEQAALAAQHALDLAMDVASVRPIMRITRLGQLLEKHATVPEVADLRERISSQP